MWLGGIVLGLAVNTTLEELYLDRNVIADDGALVLSPGAFPTQYNWLYRGCILGFSHQRQPQVVTAYLGLDPQSLHCHRKSGECPTTCPLTYCHLLRAGGQLPVSRAADLAVACASSLHELRSADRRHPPRPVPCLYNDAGRTVSEPCWADIGGG